MTETRSRPPFPARTRNSRRSDVLALMVRQGILAPLIGVGVGLLVALGLARLIQSFIAGVSPIDPLSFGGAVAGLLSVALLAILLPARRAVRTNPVDSLRTK